MECDKATTGRLRKLISQIEELTTAGEMRRQREAGSAHRFARWNNNLFILGPAAADEKMPRYLFITPCNRKSLSTRRDRDPQRAGRGSLRNRFRLARSPGS